VTWVISNLFSFCLAIVLVSVQDRCLVCARRTIGLEIVLDHLMLPQGDKAQLEACFGPFGGSANLDAR
jgi:hypothetical protein